MTTIYFIRHAQADTSVLDQENRPLTKKGKQDSLLIAENLSGIKFDKVFSSPYKRAIDTVLPLAHCNRLSVNIVNELRGLKLQSSWINNYRDFFINYWNDFDYYYADGESFAQLQSRSIAALQTILSLNKNKTILLCSHSVLIAVVLKFYNYFFEFEDFMKIADNEPYIIKTEIDDKYNFTFDVVTTGEQNV